MSYSTFSPALSNQPEATTLKEMAPSFLDDKSTNAEIGKTIFAMPEDVIDEIKDGDDIQKDSNCGKIYGEN